MLVSPEESLRLARTRLTSFGIGDVTLLGSKQPWISGRKAKQLFATRYNSRFKTHKLRRVRLRVSQNLLQLLAARCSLKTLNVKDARSSSILWGYRRRCCKQSSSTSSSFVIFIPRCRHETPAFDVPPVVGNFMLATTERRCRARLQTKTRQFRYVIASGFPVSESV